MFEKKEYDGDTSAVEFFMNGGDFLSGISPKEYDYIYDVRIEYEKKQNTGYVDAGFIKIRNISGRTINNLCSLKKGALHRELLKYDSYTIPYEPKNPTGFVIQRIVKVEKTLVSTCQGRQSVSHSSSTSSRSLNTKNTSLDGSSIGEIIGGFAMLIIAVCVFYFYAKEEFGILWGAFYSFFWYLTIPIHYFFF